LFSCPGQLQLPENGYFISQLFASTGIVSFLMARHNYWSAKQMKCQETNKHILLRLWWMLKAISESTIGLLGWLRLHSRPTSQSFSQFLSHFLSYLRCKGLRPTCTSFRQTSITWPVSPSYCENMGLDFRNIKMKRKTTKRKTEIKVG
jgi:hypothetical protein